MPPLPALQVRVPNSANALLQAENILGARQQRNALVQQEQRRTQIGNLLSGDLTDPTVRQQVQSKAFAIDPQAGAQIQTMFRQMSAEERAQTERDAQTLSRAFFGVNDQPGFDAARASLPEHLQEGVGTVFQREGVQAIVQGGLAVSDLFRRETAQLPTPPLSAEAQQQQIDQINARAAAAAANRASAGPRTNLGEINADLADGNITPPQALRLAQMALAPDETFRPVTDAERGLYQLAPDQPAQISDTTGKISTIGPGGVEVNVDLSTKTQGAIEGSILGAQDALGRLTAIENSFDPTFQQIFTRAGIKFDQLRARFGELSPQDQARLERAAVFQQNAIENVNSTIRELTGAQMSEFEARRITAQLPNPGTGIFDGDDPVSFEAKMRNATQRIRVILARKVWADANGRDALTTGFDMDGSVADIVNQRGQEIEDAFKAQGMTGEELNSAVDARLRVEFGGLL